MFAVLVGRPANDPTYLQDCGRAFEAISRAGESANFRPEEKRHRRGCFPAINVGVSHGNGTTAPCQLSNGPHELMLSGLQAEKSIQRLAAFASGKS